VIKSSLKNIDLENSYNAYLIFWTFMPCFSFIMANQVAVFYLTIERCLIIRFPIKYNKSKRKTLIKITLFTMSLNSLITVFIYSLDYPQGSQTGIFNDVISVAALIGDSRIPFLGEGAKGWPKCRRTLIY
jgi:hypothetical protein